MRLESSTLQCDGIASEHHPEAVVECDSGLEKDEERGGSEGNGACILRCLILASIAFHLCSR